MGNLGTDKTHKTDETHGKDKPMGQVSRVALIDSPWSRTVKSIVLRWEVYNWAYGFAGSLWIDRLGSADFNNRDELFFTNGFHYFCK